MEAFGAVASAAQLAATVNGILRVIREVCDELKRGPQRIRERIQYLDSLVSTLHLIRNIESLHCSEVTSQLEAIGSKVKVLKGCLCKNSSTASKRPLRRVWGAFVSIKDEDTICETLVAIEYDKNSLILSITAISAEATHHIAHWNWTRMNPGTTEDERVGRSDKSFSSSKNETQLVRRKPFSEIDTDYPQESYPPGPGCRNSPNPQDPEPQPQNPSHQSPATAFAARLSPEQKGDLSVGNVIVKDRGTLSRGNVANAEQIPERDRKFIGDYEIGEDAYIEDQNRGYAPNAWRPNNASQQNANESSTTPHLSRGNESSATPHLSRGTKPSNAPHPARGNSDGNQDAIHRSGSGCRPC